MIIMKKMMRFLMIAILLATVLTSCKKDPTDPPAVTTTDVTAITGTTATSGGEVTSEGSSTVTERGVCWGTVANPTIADSKTSDGTGVGVFTGSITGLTPGTVYHVRAFATNSHGTSYGADVEFSTSFLIKSIEFNTGDIEKWEFFYDATTKKITYFDDYWNAALDKTLTYDYSVPGKLTLMNGVDVYNTYDLNAQGYIIKDYNNGHTFEYNSDGYLTKYNEYWGGAVDNIYEMEITNGNITKITKFAADGVTLKKTKTFTYTVGDNVNGIHQANATDSEWKPMGNLYGKPSAKLLDYLEYWTPSDLTVYKSSLSYVFDSKNRPSVVTKTFSSGPGSEVWTYTYFE